MAPQPAVTATGEPTTLADAFRTLTSSPEGLTTAEAQRRLVQYGRNEPAATAGRSLVVQLALLVANPLGLILLFASGIAFLAGQHIDAAIQFLDLLVHVVLLGLVHLVGITTA